MNTVITLHDLPDEWYQDTYICCECDAEFMIGFEGYPGFCPCCGVKYDAVQIKYGAEEGGRRMETIFLKEEEDEEN